MHTHETAMLVAIERHSSEDMRALIANGLDPNVAIQGKSPIDWLTEMYTRSDRFPACLRVMLDYGAELKDPCLLSVLLDDGEALRSALSANPDLIHHRTDMVSAFTPLAGATLLHVAAEYGNLNAAEALIAAGADLNSVAAIDEAGFGGHTPIFHAVNSNDNRSAPILCALVSAGARCDVLLPGLVWGKGFEWESTFFDVTPITYAQMGLLPQMHRRESDIYANIRLMIEASGRRMPALGNVPNRYLQPRA
ncbi:MAG: ankyrin repeat domain-containing protein [Betaproteobacteria bacterium]|nr:ankyrin repeat domain-containing protein [Betaproteobacteria bacterium]